MINYKVTSSHEVTSLIPATRSIMYRVYNKYKGNDEAFWPTMGRPPILANDYFISSIILFEKDKKPCYSQERHGQHFEESKVRSCKRKGELNNYGC